MKLNKAVKFSLSVSAVIAVILCIITAVYLLFVAPSFVGKTGTEGEHLKKYVDPAELKKLTQNPIDSIWIIDVRPEKAFIEGHIPTAKSFPSSTIMSRLGELPKDKNLIIYCETGGRVQAVIRKLKKEGYTRYMNWGANYRWKDERAYGKN